MQPGRSEKQGHLDYVVGVGVGLFVCLFVVVVCCCCCCIPQLGPRREAGGFLMSPPYLESQGCQFDPTFLDILFYSMA